MITKNLAAEQRVPILERENRVKLTADIQTPHIDSLLTVSQGETGTIVGHVNEFVRVKLDFNPLDRHSPKAFELEVLPSQITLIDPNILISPELKSFIPPLSYDEREKLLHNLQLNGCREPLVVWEGHSILLDGHNRFELCTKYGIEYKVVEVRLPSFESAYSWIVSNQLGRRNLTPEAMSYLRGKLYNLEKQQGRRNDLTSASSGTKLDDINGGHNGDKLTSRQNDHKLDNLTSRHNGTKLDEENSTSRQNDDKLDEKNLTSGQSDDKLDNLTSRQNDDKLFEENLTSRQSDEKLSERLASKYKVGSRTIERDAKFALAVDNLANTVGENVRQSILSRDANLNKKETLELAAIALSEPEQVKEKFEGGRYLKEKQLTPFPYQVGEVVRISAKNEPQLRGFAGCWAVITAVHEFSGDIQMWNGTATNIHPQHLSSLGYNPSECESKKQLCERITKIIEQSPEATAMQFLSILGRQRAPELTELEEKMLSLLEREYGVETAEPQFEGTKTAEPKSEGVKESEPQIPETNQSNLQSEDTTSQPENSPSPKPQPPATKLPLLKRPTVDDIPPSRDYNDIISLIDLHMNELGWDKGYGRKFLNRTYGKTSRQLLSDEELLGFLNHLKSLYSPEELHEECHKYTEGKTVYWSGKEYQVSYVLRDLKRVILLSLSGDDVGDRYTVHPFEIGGTNN